MKKIFCTLAVLLTTAISVSAETLTGIAAWGFSTEKPMTTFAVRLNQTIDLNSYTVANQGEYLYGNVVKVVDGQRGKRQGYFEFNPTHLVDAQGNAKTLTDKTLIVKVSFYKPFDKEAAKKLAENGATTAAGIILNVPMLSQGVSFIKGATHPTEEEGRVSSGLKQVYKDSPLSYVEKGEPLILEKGQEVKLNFKNEN